MAAQVDTTQIEGYFRRTFADDAEHAVPSFADMQRDIPYSDGEVVSDGYHFPVFVRRSHGMTWAGTGTAAGSLYTLNSPVSLLSQDANVAGTEGTLQEDVSYGVLSRAQKKGEAAFGDAMDEVTFGILDSLRFYLEMAILYGGTNIGVIAGRTVDSGTSQTFQLTQGSFAPGLWAGMEGAFIDIYDDDFDPIRNTAGTLEVTAIDPDLCTITLTGTESEMDTIVAGDVVVPRGAYENWFNGVDKILTHTSGELNGINASTYHLWRANQRDVNSNKLTLAYVLSAVSKSTVRGLRGEVCVKLNTYSWDDLNNDSATLRRFTERTKSGIELGTESIKFYGSNGGTISLEPHAMVKAGDAFVFPKKVFKRIGSSDVTLKIPGVKGQQEAFYQELESKNGIRLRGYWDQTIVASKPAMCTKIKNIVPQSMEYETQAYV